MGALGTPVAAAAAASFRPTTLQADFFDRIAQLAAVPGDAKDIARDESFWREIQQSFTVDRSLINLNNGGVSPAPSHVQEAMKRHLDYSNEAPVYTMWKILEPQNEGVRQRLARQFKVDPEEIAITRNASEGLQICQMGIDLKKGDEILTTTQDYGRMINTFKQRERREGVTLKQFQIPTPSENPDEIVRLFEQNISSKTRLILMSHIINLTGQILPVKKVVQMARAKGIPVIVDGAHSFAHFQFTHEDLDCDYFATSLHKWLLAPIGTGMLYVRRDKIKDVWPLQASAERQDSDIRKFEEIGTHPAANHLAIAEALSFHQGIGSERKEERLRYLTKYWADRLLESNKGKERVRLNTSLDPRFSCAIGNVELVGVDTSKLANHLWDKNRIIVVPINHPEFTGLRVTPNVYTTLEELDRYCEAMEDVLKNGLPST
ncbi:MAG: aminotransferase class V-fold PLP-dependent enzyme [Rhodothermales bacterium]|nr:aminotransferase class V-fold PLP-dependent enzyme [Rhodothermales bacterium]